MSDMAYVPPHLRGKAKENKLPTFATAQSEDDASRPPSNFRSRNQTRDVSSLSCPKDIVDHFWPVNDHTERAIEQKPSDIGTLNPSASSPDGVAIILLFLDSNPRWKDDCIIFTKTSIDLLPRSTQMKAVTTSDAACNQNETSTSGRNENAEEASTSEPATHTTSNNMSGDQHSSIPKQSSDAIAVFEQVRGGRRGYSFGFSGWYRIVRTAFLEPNSADLKRMLEQKWQVTDEYGHVAQKERDERYWQLSLSKRWAVVKLEKDEESDRIKGEPKIERVSREHDARQGATGGKSVNELLAEMRVNDDKKNASIRASALDCTKPLT